MSLFFKIRSLWKYYHKAQTRYDVHSPHLSLLVEGVIRNHQDAAVFAAIEAQRQVFLNNSRLIRKQPLGAGSQTNKKSMVKISEVARTSLAPKWQGRLYHHLARTLMPENVLELGTSLGISTAYLFSGCPSAKMVSLEGDENIVPMASDCLQKIFPQDRPDILVGPFVETLPRVLSKLKNVDLVLIDGDHQYQATLDYYDQIRPFLSENAVVIVHDIYWSPGMSKAWTKLQQDKAVKLSIDLYALGLLCRSQALTDNQTFNYIPWIFKPWRIGLFQ